MKQHGISKSIAIVGTGYVGLTTGVCLASLGHEVICVDKDKERISKLIEGKSPIYELGMEELLKKNKKNIKYTTNIKDAVKNSEIIFIAVGTPSLEDGSIDISYFKKAIEEVAKNMTDFCVVVNKSTVPVGTGDWTQKEIKKFYKGNFAVVSNPEFLSEGSAIKDFLEPDRIIIGVEDKRAEKIILDLYSSIKAPKLIVDIKSAELIKYAANAFLATKISFINEIANLCERTGGDVAKVAEGIGLDKRIGPHFLKAGIGYGGSCFPKDIDGLLSISKKYKQKFNLLKVVSDVNIEQQKKFIQKIKDMLLKINGNTICALGLSFKPNTDDIRKSPAIFIIKQLLKENINVNVYDPIAINNAKKELKSKNIKFHKNALDAAKTADILVLFTEWPEFHKLDFKEVKNRMRNHYILDGRNYLDKDKIKKFGFYYEGVGRK